MGAETDVLPKALVPVAGMPVIERVMEIFARQGFDDFLVAGGYRVDALQDWAARLAASGRRGWRVEVADTGRDTDSASRLARLAGWIDGARFFLGWCDGLADIDLQGALRFHDGHGRLATVAAVHPPERFGLLDLDGPRVRTFVEKPVRRDGWINGGFFILQRSVLASLAPDGMNWETDVMTRLARTGELMAWRHDGAWMCMDTVKDRDAMELAVREGCLGQACPA
ncbi:glucose-1-phosphate cytidylyltransferase [Rhodobacterales bacterium HKCCSP123]|nr:glucose-1-phosphate cytidylyltransferase [Rhodobacterales bacterium HKCCSP123]